MSVQSRRKPSKLFTATVYGFIWVVLLALMIRCVWGTLAEIRTQAVEGTEPFCIVWYFSPLIIPVGIALGRMGGAEASKRMYLTVQLVNFTVLLGVFWGVLFLADGNGLAFFLGDPEPGVVSVYEAFFIWVLFFFGAILQMLSVMNDKHQNKIRIGVGGILFVISIFLPKLLDSYALVRATCAPPLPEDTSIKAQCQQRALETIPIFAMTIAFSAALMVLFFVSMLSPTIERFISSLTCDGADERRSGALSDAQEGAESQWNLLEREPESAVLPSSAESLHSAVQRNGRFGSFTAAVLGGAVVWMIQTVGKRVSGPR
ncbi:hypothetical protein [uncultured Actinomyces sp.]|uniref:hypothetical protein n=1 Tax=uncultured Actinomyces sp. TaxID=249061 RepID=UPI0028ED2E08|nr:hypothetical protein [uncultured Actinomyces sp.]